MSWKTNGRFGMVGSPPVGGGWNRPSPGLAVVLPTLPKRTPSTGPSGVETISAMLTKPLPGYGEIFRMLSYQEIGAAALLSRTVGGLMGNMVVLTMPGSTAAVRLAMEKLILPELGHIVREAIKR